MLAGVDVLCVCVCVSQFRLADHLSVLSVEFQQKLSANCKET